MSKRIRDEAEATVGGPVSKKQKKAALVSDNGDGSTQLTKKQALPAWKLERRRKKELKKEAKREKREKKRVRLVPKNLAKYGSTKEQKAARKLAKRQAAEALEARRQAKAAAAGILVPQKVNEEAVTAPEEMDTAPGVDTATKEVPLAIEGADTAADAERKALKRAAKVAKKAAKAGAVHEDQIIVDDPSKETVTAPEEIDTAQVMDIAVQEVETVTDAERKALKRAAKAAKKAAKAGAVHGGHITVENGSEEEPVDNKADMKAAKVASVPEEQVTFDDGTAEVSAGAGAEDDAAAIAKAERKALKRAAKETKKNGSVATDEKPSTAKPETNGRPAIQGDSMAYAEHTELTALPTSDIATFLESQQITVHNSGVDRRPITSFKYLPITEEQRAPFKGFAAPTPIQAAAWPYLLDGRDVIGVAETGSGKTLAFGVPCIRRLSALDKKSRSHIKACIVSPTRELALQIQEQLAKFTAPFGIKVTVVYGGVNKDEQRATLKGTQIVVATPGRLNDFIQEGSIDLSHADYMVLDEADRMLDKGFEEEVRKIVSSTASSGRQTLMFTATWPPSVRDLASTFMTNPVRINIGDNTTGELRANNRIVQEVEVVDPADKQNRLIQLLKQYQSGKNKNDRILVFCLYKKEATRIEEFIHRKGFNVAGIHGDLSQQKRTESLEAFKQGKVPVLVATDVAARGLDIPAVKLVINVTFPLTAEDYVHRIGRTGRAGQDGRAITFFTDQEKGLAGALINVLKAANQPVPDELLKFGTTVKKKGHDVYGAFYKETADMKAATKITFD